MFQKLIYLLHAMSPIVNCDKLYSLFVKEEKIAVLGLTYRDIMYSMSIFWFIYNDSLLESLYLCISISIQWKSVLLHHSSK